MSLRKSEQLSYLSTKKNHGTAVELRRAMLLKCHDFFFPDGEISRFPACLHIFAAGKRGFEIWRQSEMLIGLKKPLPAWKVERIHSKESTEVKTNIKRTKCFFHSFHQSAGTVAIHDVLSSFSRWYVSNMFYFHPWGDD